MVKFLVRSQQLSKTLDFFTEVKKTIDQIESWLNDFDSFSRLFKSFFFDFISTTDLSPTTEVMKSVYELFIDFYDKIELDGDCAENHFMETVFYDRTISINIQSTTACFLGKDILCHKRGLFLFYVKLIQQVCHLLMPVINQIIGRDICYGTSTRLGKYKAKKLQKVSSTSEDQTSGGESDSEENESIVCILPVKVIDGQYQPRTLHDVKEELFRTSSNDSKKRHLCDSRKGLLAEWPEMQQVDYFQYDAGNYFEGSIFNNMNLQSGYEDDTLKHPLRLINDKLCREYILKDSYVKKILLWFENFNNQETSSLDHIVCGVDDYCTIDKFIKDSGLKVDTKDSLLKSKYFRNEDNSDFQICSVVSSDVSILSTDGVDSRPSIDSDVSSEFSKRITLEYKHSTSTKKEQ